MSYVILVVDDDEATREGIKELLEAKSAHCRIHTASDPLDAISLFHKYKDALTHVVVDYFMPIDNGIEFCKVVKDNNPKIQVVLFSGNKDLEDSLPKGVVDKFFVKPNGREVVEFILN